MSSLQGAANSVKDFPMWNVITIYTGHLIPYFVIISAVWSIYVSARRVWREYRPGMH